MIAVEIMQPPQDPDLLKTKADFLEPFGLSVYGEPLDYLSGLGERISALPRQRCIDFRANAEGKPVLKSVKEGSNNAAAWAQTRGFQVSHACSTCAAGNGPFVSCVVLKNLDCQHFFDGSCANCHFNKQGSKCSFRGCSLTLASVRDLD